MAQLPQSIVMTRFAAVSGALTEPLAYASPPVVSPCACEPAQDGQGRHHSGTSPSCGTPIASTQPGQHVPSTGQAPPCGIVFCAHQPLATPGSCCGHLHELSTCS